MCDEKIIFMQDMIGETIDSNCGIEEHDRDEVEAIRAYQKRKKAKALELNEINELKM